MLVLFFQIDQLVSSMAVALRALPMVVVGQFAPALRDA